MKISAIEIGTNSTKFIIAEANGRSFNTIEKSSIINRLSRNMYGQNLLSPEAVSKTLQIIGEMIERSKISNAELISIFSTSVLRDANNSKDFIDMVKKTYGYTIEVISGGREAYLVFRACGALLDDNQSRFRVIDIGGGSTELIVGTNEKIESKASLNIGAVRLTEQFVNGNGPIEHQTIETIIEFINLELEKINGLNFRTISLIGTGGTVKTLGTIVAKVDYQLEDQIHGLKVERDKVKEIVNLLAGISLIERQEIPGLNPKRADVIVVGLLILLTVMNFYNILDITISFKGVLEGFLSDYLANR